MSKIKFSFCDSIDPADTLIPLPFLPLSLTNPNSNVPAPPPYTIPTTFPVSSSWVLANLLKICSNDV